MIVWAHRGASSQAPENTMAAFRAAEEAGVAAIELDVHLSRDGIPVVIHDDTLGRTTDGRGCVDRHTLRQLRRLDAGGWFSPAFASERIPTLEELFTWAQDRLLVNVEIKTAAAGAAVVDLVRKHPRVRVLISSFCHHALEQIRKDAPFLPLGFLHDSFFWRRGVERGAACGAASFHPRHDRVSAPLIAECHRRGMAVHAWTVDDPAVLRRLSRLGVDGVMTNNPGAFLQGRRSR